jgi:hypothetical protein
LLGRTGGRHRLEGQFDPNLDTSSVRRTDVKLVRIRIKMR